MTNGQIPSALSAEGFTAEDAETTEVFTTKTQRHEDFGHWVSRLEFFLALCVFVS